MIRRIASGMGLLLTVACTELRNGTAEQPPGTGTSPGTLSGSRAGSPASNTLSGTLREQIAVEPYVYLRLETADGEVWAAVLEAPVVVGQKVTVHNAFAMEQFSSQTLGRTFDQIYFGSLDSVSGVDAGGASAAFGLSAAPFEDNAGIGRIGRAQGADARTIGELWQQKEELVGVTASVRGVVVKYNEAVMGKNWIHLQDGTGSTTHGTHDLVVTSADAVLVGDTITITGVVRTNRDLGAGYVYTLLVEDARVVAR